MTINRKSKQQKQQQQRSRPRPRAKPQRKKKGKSQPSNDKAASFLSQVYDPCNATPRVGIYGTEEAMAARFHSSASDLVVSANTCGYLLWSPNYHGQRAAGTYANLVGVSASLSTWRYPNTPLSPGYLGAPFPAAGGGFAIDDPAEPFVQQSLCADARVIGACMKMRNIGKLVNLQGEFGYVNAVPNDAMLQHGLNEEIPSVDEIFNYSTEVDRFNDTGVGVKYIPDESAAIFNDHDTGPIKLGLPAGSVPTLATEAGKAHNPVWFGFCWRGLDPTVAKTMVFEFYKLVEWRATPISGLTQITREVTGPSLMDRVLAKLSKMDKKWWIEKGATALVSYSRGRRAQQMNMLNYQG